MDALTLFYKPSRGSFKGSYGDRDPSTNNSWRNWSVSL